MRRSLLLILMFAFWFAVSAQYNCWIQFADKKGTAGSLSNPSAYLSKRALDRRFKQQIEVDSTDLPVSSAYVWSILQKGVSLKSTSRWLNGITVILADTSLLAEIRSLPFVKKTELTLTPSGYVPPVPSKILKMPSMVNGYKNADRQIDLHNGQKLHNAGFRGAGMVIGVLDAGFYKADQIAVFDSLWKQNRLLGVRDFADPSVPFFSNVESHGTHVLSIMAANLPDQMVGVAPDASYWLIRTEYSPTEYLAETDNWVAGLEFADSVGVDVVNSSLGYSTFDNSDMNYTYAELNGRISRASRAATMAARKGMIVVAAAGNEGDRAWHYISVPADADSILTVGAVDFCGAHGAFSGYGPTVDQRVKPDVCAMGVQTVFANSDNTIATGNGTSYASPVIAGLVACVWQALPLCSNVEIMNLVKRYASQFTAPDSALGYGIPDMYAVCQKNIRFVTKTAGFSDRVVAYFANDDLQIKNLSDVSVPAVAILYTQTGQKLVERRINGVPASLSVGSLPSGFYLLSVFDKQSKSIIKLLKYK